MLSIHHVSIMMWIFYIDWQQYWKCDCERECTWQRNSINKTAKSDRLDSWASRHWRGIELIFKSLDSFTVRPTFSTRFLITRMKRVFFFFFFWGWGGGGGGGGGDCSAPVYLLFGAVYRSQGRRGYLDVSNVTLVLFLLKVVFCKSHCLNPHCQSVTVKTFGLLSLNLACFSWF